MPIRRENGAPTKTDPYTARALPRTLLRPPYLPLPSTNLQMADAGRG